MRTRSSACAKSLEVALDTRPSSFKTTTGPRCSSWIRRYQTVSSLVLTGGESGAGWDKLTNFWDGGVYLIDDSGDAAIVARCLEGQQDAYEVIVTRYQRGLFNVAFRMLGNYEDARDATQNAFVKAYEHLDSFDPEQRFFNWLYRILKNECLNVLRARRPSQPVSVEMPSARGADPVEVRERQRAIQQALLSLSTEYREVVVLRHYTDLSYDEIAAALGIPATKVRSRLYTARQQLSELLVDWQIARVRKSKDPGQR